MIILSIIALTEDSERELPILHNLLSFDFTFSFAHLYSLAIFQTKSKFALIHSTILAHLSADTLRKAIDKPAFIDISIAAINPTNILENPSKAMKVLCVDQNLALINIIGLFSNID